MQNRGLIKFFAILFALVSIYQLSFTFVSHKIESDAKTYANGNSEKELKYLDSIGKEKVFNLGFTDFTYNEVKDKKINKGLDLEDAPDSYSFKKAVLKPNQFYERPPLVHRDAQGRKAIRFEGWKFIEEKNKDTKRKMNAEMLFSLTKDKKESTNLAKTEIAVVDKAKTYLTKIIEKSSKKIWENN